MQATVDKFRQHKKLHKLTNNKQTMDDGLTWSPASLSSVFVHVGISCLIAGAVADDTADDDDD